MTCDLIDWVALCENGAVLVIDGMGLCDTDGCTRHPGHSGRHNNQPRPATPRKIGDM